MCICDLSPVKDLINPLDWLTSTFFCIYIIEMSCNKVAKWMSTEILLCLLAAYSIKAVDMLPISLSNYKTYVIQAVEVIYIFIA